MAKKSTKRLRAPMQAVGGAAAAARRKSGPRKRRFGAFTAVLMLLAIAIGGVVLALAMGYEPKNKHVKIADPQGKKSTDPAAEKDSRNTDPKKIQPAKSPAKKTEAKNLDQQQAGAIKTEPGKMIPGNTQAMDGQTTAVIKRAADIQDNLPNRRQTEPSGLGGKTQKAGKDQPTAGKKTDAKDKSGALPGLPGGMTKAPVWAIHDRGKRGPIPKISDDGRSAFKVYARTPPPGNEPVIAIVVTNLGRNSRATTVAIKDLPAAITLAFSPYAKGLQSLVDAARKAGHEVLVEVPMEPLSYPNDDPGPLAMLTGLPTRINVERLELTLGKFAGYVGAIGKMGGRFGKSEPAMRPILQRLKDAGLMFLDNRASNTIVPIALADKIGLPRAYVDRLIDRRPTRSAIENRLADLEKIARAQGFAIGQGFAYPVTIERLVVWSQRLAQSGIRLAPVSALAGKQPAVR